MSRFYNTTFVAVPSTVIRSQGDLSQFASVQAGFEAAEIELDAALRAPNGEAPARLPDAATRASKSLAFDVSGNPIAVIAATSAEMSAAVAAAASAEADSISAAADAATVAGASNALNLLQLRAGIQ